MQTGQMGVRGVSSEGVQSWWGGESWSMGRSSLIILSLGSLPCPQLPPAPRTQSPKYGTQGPEHKRQAIHQPTAVYPQRICQMDRRGLGWVGSTHRQLHTGLAGFPQTHYFLSLP